MYLCVQLLFCLACSKSDIVSLTTLFTKSTCSSAWYGPKGCNTGDRSSTPHPVNNGCSSATLCQDWDDHLIYWADYLLTLTILLTCPSSNSLLCYLHATAWSFLPCLHISLTSLKFQPLTHTDSQMSWLCRVSFLLFMCPCHPNIDSLPTLWYMQTPRRFFSFEVV